ncbi:hypothetical protein ES708_22008 [subsurface metagenome]
MAKPKNPLLSLGARGTIADSLTFQKRGRATIARQKPIPKDPKSEAQLAQRQRYKEAVASWHSLTPEEKETWRGVCPGLTSYQCFMRSKLWYVPPVPPPEEYTEEQTQFNNAIALSSPYAHYAGQRLIISNREVTKLGFWLVKANAPTGDVIFQIRRISPDQVIASKLWGDASTLPTTPTYEEVKLDTPTLINAEVRICVYYPYGNIYSFITLRYQDTDVKANEYFSYFVNTTWQDTTDSDAAYRYKYYLP